MGWNSIGMQCQTSRRFRRIEYKKVSPKQAKHSLVRSRRARRFYASSSTWVLCGCRVCAWHRPCVPSAHRRRHSSISSNSSRRQIFSARRLKERPESTEMTEMYSAAVKEGERQEVSGHGIVSSRHEARKYGSSW